MTATEHAVHHQRPPFWRNVAVLKWGAQLLALVGIEHRLLASPGVQREGSEDSLEVPC